MKHHQHSRSAVARTVNESADDDALAFVCFDLMEYTLPFCQRVTRMQTVWQEIGADRIPALRLLDTKTLESADDVSEYFE